MHQVEQLAVSSCALTLVKQMAAASAASLKATILLACDVAKMILKLSKLINGLCYSWRFESVVASQDFWHGHQRAHADTNRQSCASR